MIRIAVEGLDGSGKTTQVNSVVSFLQQHNKTVLKTREVGAYVCETSLKLRELVLDPTKKLNGKAMEFIFAAMRVLAQDKYKEMENDYNYLVSDREWMSHTCYTDHNVDENFSNEFYNDFLSKHTQMPNYVIYLDIDPLVALKRRTSRGETFDAIEMKGVEFQQKVRSSFLGRIPEMQYRFNVPVFIIDASQPVDVVTSEVNRIITDIMKKEESVV